MLFSQHNSLNLLNQMNMVSWGLDTFNDLTLFLELFIALSVMMALGFIFLNSWNQSLNHWMILEFIWTILPVMVLVILGCPSLKLLYLQEFFQFSSNLSLKVLGHQWYWEYSFPELMLNMNSYPKMVSNLFRLGEADNIFLPFNMNIRILISSQDVIHSWALPSLALKMDASPGRLNFLSAISNIPGSHIGQCSELCGAYHSWMPIYVEFTSSELFFEWCKVNI